jgi:hypothetical protein
MQPDSKLIRFVRDLLSGAEAQAEGDVFRVGSIRVSAVVVADLISRGALAGDRLSCRANGETRAWLKRSRLDAGNLAAQHRVEENNPDGSRLNLVESPLARLAAAGANGPAFLERHQVEAGERVRRLVERARLQPRLTMSYSESRSTGETRNTAGELSDFAVDARRKVGEIHEVLPEDCAGVVLDVCGFLKGLQEIEGERGWPRRSAKLVLRIGLEQLAKHWGITTVAQGPERGRARGWMEGARPEEFE